MFASKKRLIISTLLIVCLIAAAVVFIPSWKMDKTITDTIAQLNDTYKDDFTITWSDLEEQPLSSSFYATAKSKDSGIVYDVTVEKGKGSLDYKQENQYMKMNRALEEEMPGTYALIAGEGEGLYVRLLGTEELTQSEVTDVADALKEEYDVGYVTLYSIVLEPSHYELVTAHISDYYQRSTVPENAFDDYKPIVLSVTR